MIKPANNQQAGREMFGTVPKDEGNHMTMNSWEKGRGERAGLHGGDGARLNCCNGAVPFSMGVLGNGEKERIL